MNAPNAIEPSPKSSADRAIGALRGIGWAEGCSFLLLLGVAMPLKYWVGIALAVKVAGWLHGALFILLLAALGRARLQAKLPVTTCLVVLLASLLPFGPFAVDRKLSALLSTPRSTEPV